MRIDGNYDSSSNYNYLSHKHHITECLHEEQNVKKYGGDLGSSMSAEGKRQEAVEYFRERGIEIPAVGDLNLRRKKTGLFQRIWDALGHDESGAGTISVISRDRAARESNFFHRGISTLLVAVREGFSHHVVNRAETVREKIKVGIHTALKRFGKNNEPFGNLTDPGTGSFLNSRADEGSGNDKKENGTRTQKAPVESVFMTEDHLMDSYSKSGKYCKLGENLTYQQGRAPYRVSDRIEQENQEDSF